MAFWRKSACSMTHAKGCKSSLLWRSVLSNTFSVPQNSASFVEVDPGLMTSTRLSIVISAPDRALLLLLFKAIIPVRTPPHKREIIIGYQLFC